MEDKLIEVWKKEFERLMIETYPHRSLETSDGKFAYEDRDVFYWFTGFKMAKQSQPVVELPNIEHCSGKYKNGFYDAMNFYSNAGIPFKVRGE